MNKSLFLLLCVMLVAIIVLGVLITSAFPGDYRMKQDYPGSNSYTLEPKNLWDKGPSYTIKPQYPGSDTYTVQPKDFWNNGPSYTIKPEYPGSNNYLIEKKKW